MPTDTLNKSVPIDSINGSIVLIGNTRYSLFDSTTTTGIEGDYINLQECQETKDSLYSLLETKDLIISFKQDKIESLTKEGELKDAMYGQSVNYIANLELNVKNLNKAAKKKRIVNTIKDVGLGITIVGLAGTVIYEEIDKRNK